MFIGVAAMGAGIETTLENTSIAAGERTTLVIRITGASNIKPVAIPKVPGLDISFQGKEVDLRIFNMKRTSSIALRFLIEAEKEGRYRIPPFEFEADGEKLMSREMILAVGGTASFPRQEAGPARVKTKTVISRHRAFAGQPVIVRYFLLASGIDIRFHGFENLPETRGFIVKELNDKLKDEEVTENGTDYVQINIISLILIPAAAGDFSVGGRKGVISHEASEKFFDNFFPFGRMPVSRQRRVMFESQELAILPIPQAGKPAGFNGDVGSFSLGAEYTDEPVKIFAEKRVTVTVRGRGNLLTLSKPVITGNTGNARVIAGEGTADIAIKNNEVTGEKRFVFSVIPESAGKIDAGRFRLDFFNPESGRYEFSETGNVFITVSGEKSGTKGMDFDRDEEKAEFNPLFIIMLIVLLAAVVLLVVAWERKSFGAVFRREADGAARKENISPGDDPAMLLPELEKAAASSDSESFFRHAGRILGAACRGRDPGVKERLDEIKDRLYRSRFGGGVLSDDDMREILAEIKRIPPAS